MPPNHVPDPMPCRGIAYQSRVQTLGIHPDKETRVLKERRIACVSRTSTTPTLCGVLSEHLSSVVPDISIERIDFKQGGMVSANRTYLRVRKERVVYDLCSGAFGSSWWFSARACTLPRVLRVYEIILALFGLASWAAIYWYFFGPSLGAATFAASMIFVLIVLFSGRQNPDIDDFLLHLPVFGAIYECYFRKETYHRQDSRLMFGEIVNALIRAKVTEFCAAGGVDEPQFVTVDAPEQILSGRTLTRLLGKDAEQFL